MKVVAAGPGCGSPEKQHRSHLYSSAGPGPGPGDCLAHQEQGFTRRICPGGSVGKESACNEGDVGSIPGLGRSPGGGHANPLPYFCLANPMDRGTWRAAVHGLTKSQTQLRTQHRAWSQSVPLALALPTEDSTLRHAAPNILNTWSSLTRSRPATVPSPGALLRTVLRPGTCLA